MPYGLGAESIDAALNYYVASNYSPRVMNFLHCFYGVGTIISPNIMAFALLKANWHAGYLWTAILQGFFLFVCIISLPLWKVNEKANVDSETSESVGIMSSLKVPGVILLYSPSFLTMQVKPLIFYGHLAILPVLKEILIRSSLHHLVLCFLVV